MISSGVELFYYSGSFSSFNISAFESLNLSSVLSIKILFYVSSGDLGLLNTILLSDYLLLQGEVH